MKQKPDKDPIAHLTAGAISGLSSCVLLQPFDLLKTRLQQERQFRNQLQNLSSAKLSPMNSVLVSTVKNIIAKDSITGLWRGTVPTIFRNVPGSALYFLTLSEIRQLFKQYSRLHTTALSGSGSSLPVISSRDNLIAGMTARGIAGLIVMPATVIKVRYESSFYSYKSVWSAATSILKTEGFKGFFYGYGATVLRDAPQAGLYVLFYERAKLWIGANSYAIASPIIHSSSALFAGISATILTQPFDMVKTRMQLKPLDYRNMLQAARKVFLIPSDYFQEEGFLGFFDGITMRLARKPVQSAVAWTIYEEIVTQFHKYRNTMAQN
ncbi:12051_t:CDS:2 [Ambispora leptoticha]|uniref:Mitochondrial glycine transporter n=1 Tax=Ambispora leptoticha TaxID=144679 RepID=A0A9N8Z604_9GLOM|nr:12051_t:CDS:2 [Ambispora leptoticha]